MGVKGVGFWKKLKTLSKTVAQPLGKTFDFINQLYRKNHKIADKFVEMLPGGGVIKEGLHTVSDLADNYMSKNRSDSSKKLVNNVSQVIDDVVDVTQNYSSPLDRAKRVNDIARERSGLSSRYQTSGGSVWDDV